MTKIKTEEAKKCLEQNITVFVYLNNSKLGVLKAINGKELEYHYSMGKQGFTDITRLGVTLQRKATGKDKLKEELEDLKAEYQYYKDSGQLDAYTMDCYLDDMQRLRNRISDLN